MPAPADSLDPRWTLRQGDCLEVLAQLNDASVDLVYVDPPFNSGVARKGRAGLQFADRFVDAAAYRNFLAPRLAAMHRVLKPTGSILVHVDWHTSHHVRLLLDEVFGPAAFVNHLVWSYGLGGSGPRSFARKHDDIFFYGRTGDYWFEPPRVPARSARLRGRTKKATDVIEIASINNMAFERTGYPTQKPIALLSLLVRACCKPGGTVLDPTCGSGTTLVAAVESNRIAIGIDQSSDALRIARQRLERVCNGTAVRVPTLRVARASASARPAPPPLARSA
ncbi:MAG: site-specific DNA-methyltransferase [Phycisphaerales bacterium]|nr:site-specific DNA-methyltransferase [Phycisphaerales bacterium]